VSLFFSFLCYLIAVAYIIYHFCIDGVRISFIRQSSNKASPAFLLMVLAAEPSSRLRYLMCETRLLPSGLGLAMMHLPLRTFVNTMRCSQLLQSNYIASLVLHFSVQHRLDSTCAMAASPLQALPPEIFEGINVLLSLRDLSNVRLVSRSMASKATQDRFASFVRS
jgi:hypothetical protein